MSGDREAWTALAERCEAATGPDAALDEAIYRALGYWYDADEAE